MTYFLGIDGGQSSTTALIADESGLVIGEGRDGPCNHVASAEAEAKFRRVINECISQAGGSGMHFRAVCCGMSGGPADKSAILQAMLKTDQLSVLNDGEIALAGALSGEPGIVVIAGTGSFALGRDAARTGSVGGWGYIFGDEGGSFDIARQAVRACLRFEEGWGTPTALLDALLHEIGASTANEMMHWFYRPEWPRARVARLSKVVDAAAVAGDGVARTILEQAGQSLASFAGSVRARLFKPEESTTVSYIGGAFRSDILRQRFRLLVELTDGCTSAPPLFEPAAGALIEAFRQAGLVKLRVRYDKALDQRPGPLG